MPAVTSQGNHYHVVNAMIAQSGSEMFLDGQAFFDHVKEMSKKNRDSPVECFCEFLDHIWKENTKEEALQQWEVKVEQFPWYADDALYCMDAVIADPPPNLVELMEEHGWIYLAHEPNEAGIEVQYSYDEYLEWLKQLRDEYRAIYDGAPIYETEEQ